jgi:hypothetical protein
LQVLCPLLLPKGSTELQLGYVLTRGSKDIPNIRLPCLLSKTHTKLADVGPKGTAKLADLRTHPKQALALLGKELLTGEAGAKQACPKLLLLQRLLGCDVLLLLGKVLRRDATRDVCLFLCPRKLTKSALASRRT